MKLKNKIKYLLPAFLLLFLSGCKNVVDPKTGQVMEKFIISKTSAWSLSLGFFEAVLIWPIAQIINFLSDFGGPVMAIILVTVAINILTGKLNIDSQMMSQRMQMLQPQLAKIQEKYKGAADQQAQMRQAQEMQRLYQKYDIKMSKMFLPMLLQFPILISMWQGIQRSAAVVHGEIFGNPLFMSPLRGMKEGQIFYYILAVVVIITQLGSMFLPQWLSKKSQRLYPGEKPTKNQNQSMMIFMSLLVVYIGISVASGMAIYLILSSLIRIAFQFFIQKKINESGEKFR